MAEWTTQLPLNRYFATRASRGWAWRNALVPGSEGSRPVIDDGLTPATNPARLIVQIFVRSPETLHAIDLAVGNSQSDLASRRDLSDAFETSGSVTIGVGGVDYTFSLTGSDLSEPYQVPGSTPTVLWDALASATAATLTLRDFTPAAPSWTDDTGDAITGVAGTAISPVTVPAVDAGAVSYTHLTLPTICSV